MQVPVSQNQILPAIFHQFLQANPGYTIHIGSSNFERWLEGKPLEFNSIDDTNDLTYLEEELISSEYFFELEELSNFCKRFMEKNGGSFDVVITVERMYFIWSNTHPEDK
jgi:hypothetical protein